MPLILTQAWIALLGFAALQGKLSIRRGGQTIIGIFILFGAPTIAVSFSDGLVALGPNGPAVVFNATDGADIRGDLPSVAVSDEAQTSSALQSDELLDVLPTEILEDLRAQDAESSGR